MFIPRCAPYSCMGSFRRHCLACRGSSAAMIDTPAMHRDTPSPMQSLPHLAGALARTLRQRLHALANDAANSAIDTLISVAMPCPCVNPVALFRAAAAVSPLRIFWEAPEQSLALVGIDDVRTFAAGSVFELARSGDEWPALIAAALIDAPPEATTAGPLLLGGASFDPTQQRSAL